MSEEIKAGELVMVVRGMPCCNRSGYFGFTFKVGEIFLSSDLSSYACKFCGTEAKDYGLSAEDTTGDYTFFLCELKRIDPPALPESVDEAQEVTA